MLVLNRYDRKNFRRPTKGFYDQQTWQNDQTLSTDYIWPISIEERILTGSQPLLLSSDPVKKTSITNLFSIMV